MDGITLEVNGGTTLLDPQDYEYFKNWRWNKHPSGYITRAKRINGKWTTIYLHREIIKPQLGLETDHINRDRGDNRRSNLRLVTTSQNAHNRKVRRDSASGIMGVHQRKDSGKWQSYLTVRGIKRSLGCYLTKEEAKFAYETAKKQYT